MPPNAVSPLVLLVAIAAATVGAADARKPKGVKREFKAAEYASVNDALATLEGSDTPPRLVLAYTPIYPASRALGGVAGRCIVVFKVDVDGRATAIRVQSGDEKMCAHSVYALHQWRFEPATTGGAPVLSSPLRMPFDYATR